MFFSTGLCLYKEIKYVKSIFNIYRKSLQKGSYWIHPTIRFVILNTEEIKNNATPYFPAQPIGKKVQAFVRFFNYFGWKNHSKSASAFYQAIYIANNRDKEREIKLFSFDKQKILVLCTSERKYLEQMHIYHTLSNVYMMPPIFPCDEYKNAYEIAMVKLTQRPLETIALKEIALSTAKLAQMSFENHTAESIISYQYAQQFINDTLKQLEVLIAPNILSLSFPFCTQHGDLSADNLLFGECEGKCAYWWIDWEHVSNRIFFYDYFFYILNTAKCGNSMEALKCFLRGESDQYLAYLFDAFGCCYFPEHRIDYFLIFFICFLKERVCDLGRVSALVDYCDWIKANVLPHVDENKSHGFI